MKTAHSLKQRVLTVFLCMTLLSGLVVGSIGISAAEDTKTVTKYAVDFADLAALVPDASYTDGKYTPASVGSGDADDTDTKISNWINERLGLYYNRTAGSTVYEQYNYLGESSTARRGKIWQIYKDGYLTSNQSWLDDSWEWCYNTYFMNLCEQGEPLVLDNFEAEIVFNQKAGRGGLFVSFNQLVPGKWSWAGNGDDTTALMSDTIAYATSQEMDHTAGSAFIMQSYGETITSTGDATAYEDGDNFSTVSGTTYKMYVKVVGDDLTVKLSTADGTLVKEKTYEDQVVGKDGYISIGFGQGYRHIKSITVTELDENGITVDLGTHAAAKENVLQTAMEYSVDFADLATLVPEDVYTSGVYTPASVGTGEADDTDTKISNWINERFDLYYNREPASNVYKQFSYLGDSTVAQGGKVWQIYQDGYLTSNQTWLVDSWEWCYNTYFMNLCEQGEPMLVDNFEAEVVFNQQAGRGGLFISFNQLTPGKWSWAGSGDNLTALMSDTIVYATSQEMDHTAGSAFIMQSYGETITSTGDATAYEDGDNFSTVSGTTYKMYVKVVGDDLTVKLSTADGTLVKSKTYENQVRGKDGYISVGFGQGYRHIESIKVTRLDDDGNALQFENTAVVNEATDAVTVKVKEDSELKAGSLIVTDVNGVRHIPTRVGFQTADNTQSEVYQVLNANGQPVSLDGATVTAEFYEPNLEQPNIGLIGTSVHTEKEGLRFIHRANITQGDDGWYMNFGEDGVKKVKDFGLLLVSSYSQGGKYAADPANALTLDNTLKSKYDKEYSMLGATYGDVTLEARNTYFDISDSYVDIAIEIQNIVKGGGETDDLLTRLYVVLEDGSVIYGASTDENYKNAGGLYSTEALPALVADNRLKTVGRQEIASDKIVMEYNNAAVTLYGELEGTVSMRVANTSSAVCIAHVVVDGDTANASTVLIRNGDTDITLCKGLEKGTHTIELIRSTCCDWPALELYSVTYSGTLSTPPARDLQIEFLGDSITCAVGAIKADGVYDFGWKWQDGFYSYAAITARNLNADASVLSLSGRTTSEVHAKFDDVKCNTDDGAWNLAANPQDIVVINLGTNDFWHNTTDGVINYDLAAQIDALLADVRNAYGEDTYIVWAYGMMPIADNGYIKTAVESYAAETNDTRILYCDMTSVVNSNGWGAHPNEAGHEAAAELLTAFLRENCM